MTSITDAEIEELGNKHGFGCKVTPTEKDSRTIIWYDQDPTELIHAVIDFLREKEQQHENTCHYCNAPCVNVVLSRGGEHGWGDDKSRTIQRYIHSKEKDD